MFVIQKEFCNFALSTKNAVIAQLVEHQLPKLRVAGSSPVYRSLIFSPTPLFLFWKASG